VLNDRGLDLLPSDMLKADIIGMLPEKFRNSYTKRWEDLEDDLGRDYFNDLFGHIRMILLESKAKKTIIEELKETLEKDTFNPAGFVDDILYPYADAYSTILGADFENSEDPSRINSLLRWLQRIDNSDWIPPAILFLSEHPNDIEALAQFFTKLERLASSLFLRGIGVNERIERYAELIRQIKSGNGFATSISALDLSNEEINDSLRAIEGDVYLMSKRPRSYLLLRLNSWLAEPSCMSDPGSLQIGKILTVEHVLPQTVEEGSYWTERWPKTENREIWLHKLGNLLLLTRRKNSEAQNYDFSKKKSKYFTGRSGVSTFALTTTVLSQYDWTEEIVSNRQKDLVDKIKIGWDLVIRNESS
jgi:hypothetical protein